MLVGVGVLVLPAVPASAAVADLAVSKVDTPDPVAAGANITYTIGVTNNGPDPATTPTLSDTTPASTTFVSVSANAGWSCPTTPPVGGIGAVACSGPTLANGASATVTLTVNVNAATPIGTVITNSATASSPDDASVGNNTATATTTVNAGANLLVLKSDSPDPAVANGNITYAVSVQNDGPQTAISATLSDAVPA